MEPASFFAADAGDQSSQPVGDRDGAEPGRAGIHSAVLPVAANASCRVCPAHAWLDSRTSAPGVADLAPRKESPRLSRGLRVFTNSHAPYASCDAGAGAASTFSFFNALPAN